MQNKQKERKARKCVQVFHTSIRLTEEEGTFLKEQADYGFRSVSDQVRMIIKQWRADRGL
jgi:hypothetical protein